MNYNYDTQSDRELAAVLENQHALRYEAQVELLETLEQRGIESQDLAAEVLRKKEQIASLGYLKEMGYDVQMDANGTTIKRNTKSQLTDFFGSVLGVIFIFLGAQGVIELWMHFSSEDPLSLSLLFKNGLLAILGFYGIKMLSGFSRFIDNLGLALFYVRGNVTLKKRIDFKVDTFEGAAKDVVVDATGNSLVLLFKRIPVIKGNPNSKVQQLSLSAIKSHIENS